ncbi:MAG: L,D-transpeptidase family protein [Gammaproteobacteria bacterium]|nr:L,D-transpeptidase family protein [Gammaproteobacteria bacterium]
MKPPLSFLLGVLLLSLITAGACWSGQKADAVLVIKNEGRLYLMKKGQSFASFRATFGANPVGHKEVQGDERTPEGHYFLDYKNRNSKFYKSIHISYPNARDREKARRMGVDPGGDIMIHGQTNGYGWAAPITQLFSWTDGCVALSDSDMDRVWDAVDPGTPIEIRP